MPSEVDPLLPHGPSAPEISGYGFSKNSQSAEVISDDDPLYPAPFYEQEPAEPASAPRNSALSSLNVSVIAYFIFLIVVVWITFSNGNLPCSDCGEPMHPPAMTVKERAAKILDETPLIDGHNDLAIFVRYAYRNQIHTSKFISKFEEGGMEMNVDMPRLRTGKVGGAFWSAFVGCPNNASLDFSDSNYGVAVSETLSQIDLLRRLQEYYPHTFTPASSSLSHALAMFHANKSLISPISIEGLHQISQSAPMSTLRLYHALGVRAATLTWNCHNSFADAALITSDGTTSVAPYHRGGVTELGRKVLREMNRLGILIDLSHTSYWTQKAVLSNNTSLAPVIYSHSSAFSICQHPRNVHDDILDLVKKTKSIVMINFTPEFISCLPPPNSSVLPQFYEKNSTIHQVARHVVYVGNRIGYDYVGLGSDFDGMFKTPQGLEGVDKFPDLVAEILEMGISDEDAAKVVGGNLLRVWMSADKVAKNLREEGVLEGEDEVAGWPS